MGKKTEGIIGNLRQEIENIKEDMVNKYIKKFEKTYNREPSETEIDKMYARAQKIISKNIRRFGIRVAALLGVVGLGIGGIVWVTGNDDTKALSEGKPKKQIEEEVKGEDFRESLKVLSEEEKIRQEIDELDTMEKVDAFLKDIYIEEYEKVTGDESLKTSDIIIGRSNQTYVYQLDDGQMVSHGDYPYETEEQIMLDGNEWTATDEMRIYTVNLKESGKTIDLMSPDLKKIISGNNYTETKNNNSILVNIGQITKKAFRLKDLLGELEMDPQNGYIQLLCSDAKTELADAVIEYNNSKDTGVEVHYHIDEEEQGMEQAE